jgi:perosamine synthetase
MFKTKRSFGDHTVLQYDTESYKFKEYLQQLFNTTDLENLHLQSQEYQSYLNGSLKSLENVETDIQKKFYKDIKTNLTFKTIYCKLVRDIYRQFFPNEPFLLYQSFPSIRFQFPNNIAVPAHCDSDELGKHPRGEKNFLVPITQMKESTRLFIESKAKEGDFQGVDLDHGDLFFFNGNTCIHYNQENTNNYLRVSFDFRVMTPDDYTRYIQTSSVTQTNPRDIYKERVPVKMFIGGYYQCMFQNQSIDDSYKWFHNNSFIIQTRPNFNSNEGRLCAEYFETGDPFLTEFKQTEKLEREFANYIGVNHCYMTTSGSTALVVALLACGIKAGDDVLVPNYTMIATANAVMLLGANPILIDVDPETYTVNLKTIQEKRTPKTKAVIHVSLNNRSCDIESIAAYCKRENLYLIEDSAQSLGCRLDGKHYGTFGDVGCFSLSTPKIITTGQGGFVVTKNREIADKMFKIKNFGRASGGVEQYDTFGLNFKFTDIQAVIGLAQLSKLEDRVKRMRDIHTLYYSRLKDISGLSMRAAQNDEWIPWFIEIISSKRDELSFFLKQHNIGTRVTYPSIHLTEPYKGISSIQGESFPHSSFISENGLFLPSHTCLTDEEIIYICQIIKIFFLVTSK